MLEVHTPPTSADPQPPLTVRANRSSATAVGGGGGGATTVTGWVVASVAPSSSVTVSETEYVPAAV